MTDTAPTTPHLHSVDECQVRETLDRVADKWSLYVLSHLGERELRFSELRRAIPEISQRMLTVTLRGLERDGVVDRHVRAVMPPHIGYSLTPLGAQLREAVRPLLEFAVAELPTMLAARAAYDERAAAIERGELQRVPLTTPTS